MFSQNDGGVGTGIASCPAKRAIGSNSSRIRSATLRHHAETVLSELIRASNHYSRFYCPGHTVYAKLVGPLLHSVASMSGSVDERWATDRRVLQLEFERM